MEAYGWTNNCVGESPTATKELDRFNVLGACLGKWDGVRACQRRQPFPNPMNLHRSASNSLAPEIAIEQALSS